MSTAHPKGRTFASFTWLGAPGAFERRLRVADVLGFDAFAGAEAVAGAAQLENHVARVNVMQVPTGRYARAGDLVLAAADVFAPDGVDAAGLVRALAAAEVAGVAVRGDCDAALGTDALALADEQGLPVLQLPSSRHLDELLHDVLEALVAAQARELRLAADVRDQLAGLVLAGSGLRELPEAVAAIFGGEVALVDIEGEVLAASREADVDQARAVAGEWLSEAGSTPARSDDGWAVWPVIAGGETLACLVARAATMPEGVRLAALEHGANAAALELMNERETVAAAAGLRERFVLDLVAGGLEPGAARRRAQAVDWREDARYRVLLAAPYSGELARRIAELEPDALVAHRADTVLALVPHGPPGGDRTDALAAALAADGRTAVATSDAHAGLETLPAALTEAQDALRAARAFDAQGSTRRFAELGPLRMLGLVPGPELRAFATHELAALWALEPEQREPLLRTLELLLETGLNAAETARRGGWHYNTVRYRINRLTQLIGPFLEDGARLQSVALALLLERELRQGGE